VHLLRPYAAALKLFVVVDPVHATLLGADLVRSALHKQAVTNLVHIEDEYSLYP
jgi:hypothetical protein